MLQIILQSETRRNSDKSKVNERGTDPEIFKEANQIRVGTIGTPGVGTCYSPRHHYVQHVRP